MMLAAGPLPFSGVQRGAREPGAIGPPPPRGTPDEPARSRRPRSHPHHSSWRQPARRALLATLSTQKTRAPPRVSSLLLSAETEGFEIAPMVIETGWIRMIPRILSSLASASIRSVRFDSWQKRGAKLGGSCGRAPPPAPRTEPTPTQPRSSSRRLRSFRTGPAKYRGSRRRRASHRSGRNGSRSPARPRARARV